MNEPLHGASDGATLAKLAAPKNPEDLWLATGPADVPTHRMLMQGDVVVTPDGPVSVMSHACSMRQGSAFHTTQIVAPIRDNSAADWSGYYDWMPLPCAQAPDMASPAACIRELRSESTDVLVTSTRIAVMADTGVHILQQRIAHHLSRVIIDVAELAEYSAPVLAEAELHEEWVGQFGHQTNDEFMWYLDCEDRKVRGWLSETHMRPQAMRTVRQEIRRRRENQQ
ncbi:MAG: hypothetical protein F4Y27_00030 [Acidimicrobiaceae bacterium]|nr:hypothetical protein [Acidimicrobiaceae bacterium]MYG55126.1 hypothetical protein [Acidimicrobiaceae bacterium]MYJ98139.1 hypothetical protein [Acidimicrobiaceae bacterium]